MHWCSDAVTRDRDTPDHPKLSLNLLVLDARNMSRDPLSDSHLRRRNVDSQPEQDLSTSEAEPHRLPKPSPTWFKWDIERAEWNILIVSTMLKLLLFPA